MPAFEHIVQMRWADYDPMQHVNNVVYHEFMQDARVGLIEAMGIDRLTLNVVGHFVARTEIDYLAPIGMGIPFITVKLWVTRLGGASYDVHYEFLDAAGTVYAKAKTVMVTVELATNSVVRLDDSMRELLGAFMLD
jgi:YbgC/YbaW family acyl-CoA thioester hydrolase